MKIRAGFVTNSSSSSFLLNRSSVDEVYQIIRIAYIKLEQNIISALNLAVKLGLIEDGNWDSMKDRAMASNKLDSICYEDEEKQSEELRKAVKEYEDNIWKLYRLNVSDLEYEMPKWVYGCDTYNELLNLNPDEDSTVLFRIIDHRELDTLDDAVIEAVCWYDDSMSEEPISQERVLNDLNYLTDKAIEFGTIGIYGELSDLPSLIIKELEDNSEYFCAHMG